jgi:hypothetical protein
MISMNTETPNLPGVPSARILLGLHLGEEAIEQILRQEVGLDHQEATDAITAARLLDKAALSQVTESGALLAPFIVR